MEHVTLIKATKLFAIRCIGQVYWDSQQPPGSKLGPLMIQSKCQRDLSLKCPAGGYWPVLLLQLRPCPKKANLHNLLRKKARERLTLESTSADSANKKETTGTTFTHNHCHYLKEA